MNPLRFLSRDPDEATPAQRIAGVLLLLGLFVVCAVRW
jgi:hypothetical protein